MEREETAIVVAILTLALLSAILIVLFIVFQRRKNSLLLEQKDAEKRFESEISKTRIEIREETFKNISWELHDNIGQLLTLAKIQLQSDSTSNDLKLTLDKALKELRTISKISNPDFLNSINISEAIQLEVDRLNRLNYIDSEFKICGDEKGIDKKAQIIIFRIFQEFVTNTIKHSKATRLKTNLIYRSNELELSIKDNGKGFKIGTVDSPGIGLQNMKNRAALVGAEVNIISKPGKGTSLTLKYPIKS